MPYVKAYLWCRSTILIVETSLESPPRLGWWTDKSRMDHCDGVASSTSILFCFRGGKPCYLGWCSVCLISIFLSTKRWGSRTSGNCVSSKPFLEKSPGAFCCSRHRVVLKCKLHCCFMIIQHIYTLYNRWPFPFHFNRQCLPWFHLKTTYDWLDYWCLIFNHWRLLSHMQVYFWPYFTSMFLLMIINLFLYNRFIL